MLRRAFFFVVIALLAALVARSGWIDPKQSWAWGVCYAALSWAGVSLLLSLFEEVQEQEEPVRSLSSAPEEQAESVYLLNSRASRPRSLEKTPAGAPS